MAQLAYVQGRLKDASELLRQYVEIDPLNKLVLGQQRVVNSLFFPVSEESRAWNSRLTGSGTGRIGKASTRPHRRSTRMSR
jgi:hypothetical protein